MKLQLKTRITFRMPKISFSKYHFPRPISSSFFLSHITIPSTSQCILSLKTMQSITSYSWFNAIYHIIFLRQCILSRHILETIHSMASHSWDNAFYGVIFLVELVSHDHDFLCWATAERQQGRDYTIDRSISYSVMFRHVLFNSSALECEWYLCS